jgi:hypothetical protein
MSAGSRPHVALTERVSHGVPPVPGMREVRIPLMRVGAGQDLCRAPRTTARCLLRHTAPERSELR